MPQAQAQPSVVGEDLVDALLAGPNILKNVDVDAVVDGIAAANVCVGAGIENLNVLPSRVDNTGAPQAINGDAVANPDITIA
jgi:hypothetical protein